jgi:hypothetical protein
MLVTGSVFSQVFKSVIPDANWSPSSIFYGGEPGVWYDPSDITTLFQDSTGLLPVTAAGQTVGKMLDKSGRGNHATQAVPTQCPTYQVDGSGRPYLSFDGVDDGMVTPTITPATNKLQVFAGVRKLSNAVAYGTVAEMTDLGFGAGRWGLFAPSGSPPFDLFDTLGTAYVTNAASTAAPSTNVMTGISDIGSPFSSISINSVVISSSTATQGTGNYSANIIYIGRRTGTTLPFNGRLYSLVTRFGSNLTAGQIASAESWVNGKTGAY